MIYVHATIELNPGKRDEFLQEFRRIIPAVRAETGCVEYVPTVDLPSNLGAQGPVRPDVVVVVEKWTSLETLQAHLVAPHMVEYRPKVKSLVARTTLQILESAE